MRRRNIKTVHISFVCLFCFCLLLLFPQSHNPYCTSFYHLFFYRKKILLLWLYLKYFNQKASKDL
uniref:Uncharacterized protein n=1 Tax=Anguilla anguilla TaxID=7936 RepID=A0A0E9VKT5_ANGAN